MSLRTSTRKYFYVVRESDGFGAGVVCRTVRSPNIRPQKQTERTEPPRQRWNQVVLNRLERLRQKVKSAGPRSIQVSNLETNIAVDSRAVHSEEDQQDKSRSHRLISSQKLVSFHVPFLNPRKWHTLSWWQDSQTTPQQASVGRSTSIWLENSSLKRKWARKNSILRRLGKEMSWHLIHAPRSGLALSCMADSPGADVTPA